MTHEPTSLHDSKVDLSMEGEVVIRDRGYLGVQSMGISTFTMKSRTMEKHLDDLNKERNRLISILRSPGERPHAAIKRVLRREVYWQQQFKELVL